jgi:nitrogenase molybdenum-cofactor synthesis protein NifE
MRQTARIISTYTSDASGVASALYELGGMTVIHDASGCNSTYNTHDEPRWYSMDSYVFISALTEMEAVMGDDNKLVDDIVRAAGELHPGFIALCGTPIPMMTGFDFDAVARLVEEKTGIPTFGIPTNGMHTYISGAGMAFRFLAERMVKDPGAPGKSGEKISVNLLGMTPLDFSVTGMEESVVRRVEEAGFTVLSNWAMNGFYDAGTGNTNGKAKLSAIAEAGKADVNLVVSSSGLMAARVLEKRFGTPCVCGVPIGKSGMEPLAEKLRAAVNNRTGAAAERTAGSHGGNTTKTAADNADTDIVLIGEPVMQQSLAAAIREKTGRTVSVLCPIEAEDYGETEQKNTLLEDGSIFAVDEEDLSPFLKHAKTIIADPMYQPVCPKKAEFISFPHEAFSGRIYRTDIPNLAEGIPENWKLEKGGSKWQA